MNESLDRLLQKARTAPPPALPLEEPLPPGAATRIAARWAAARSPIVLWERLSYAGLAVALAVSGVSFSLGPPAAEETAAAEAMPDLFSATITDEPEG